MVLVQPGSGQGGQGVPSAAGPRVVALFWNAACAVDRAMPVSVFQVKPTTDAGYRATEGHTEGGNEAQAFEEVRSSL